MFIPGEAAAHGVEQLGVTLRGEGGAVVASGGEPGPGRLAGRALAHPAADAICLTQTIYAMPYRLAARRGADVDRPRHLQKVTRTR
jgi:glutamine---fructose-6-phosphate transaminase (isomerizing)